MSRFAYELRLKCPDGTGLISKNRLLTKQEIKSGKFQSTRMDPSGALAFKLVGKIDGKTATGTLEEWMTGLDGDRCYGKTTWKAFWKKA